MAHFVNLANLARQSHRPPIEGWLFNLSSKGMRLVACIRDVVEGRELVLFCRICLPLFARSMEWVSLVFQLQKGKCDCGCCAETATSRCNRRRPSERQKSRADQLGSRLFLGRSSQQQIVDEEVFVAVRQHGWMCTEKGL